MFGIGGSEFIFIIFIVLMLFGSDKIPDIARTIGRTMKQIRHATNDIKNEIQLSATDKSNPASSVIQEIEKVKSEFKEAMSPTIEQTQQQLTDAQNDIEKDIESLTGPIKRQM